MKRILFFVCLIFCFDISYAQETDNFIKKDKIGLTVSTLGESNIVRFQNLIGEGRIDRRRFLTFGVNYIHSLNKRIDFETGLEFESYTTTVYPAVNPDGNNFPSYGNLNFLNIPVTLRANFWRFFYINGGALIDLDISKSSGVDAQTGIGTMLGVGWKYDFKSGWQISINPYSKLHSLISFSNSNYPQRLLETGCRWSVMIPLK